MSKTYKATAYLRLSYTGDHSAESDSVANQRRLIADFVAQRPEIQLVTERVDDGYSGILFDRPAFQEMMADIKNGAVNCVIVKDLSRLGREHIETSRYLRQIFPAFGVRFIAVTDHIDTEDEHTGDDLVLSVKLLTTLTVGISRSRPGLPWRPSGGRETMWAPVPSTGTGVTRKIRTTLCLTNTPPGSCRTFSAAALTGPARPGLRMS